MKIIIIKPFEIVPGRILPPGTEVFNMEDEYALRAISEGKGKRYCEEKGYCVTTDVRRETTKIKRVKTKLKNK